MTTKRRWRPVLADAASRCDAIVTSGGVSMGDYDIVKAVLDRVAEMRWMQIAIRPAKPFAFGLLPGPERPVPVFGLPGNPVSSLVSFELLARPALRKMMGHAAIDRTRLRAVADDGLPRRPDGKVHWNRVVGALRERRPLPRPLDRRARAATNWPRPRRPTPWPRSPTATGIEPGGDVDVLLLTA